MAGFYGGDTEQMRQHGTACQRGSQRLVEVTEAASALIDSASWVGPDAVAFRELWHGTVKPGMLARADDVRAMGQGIDRHADKQDQASAGDGTGGALARIRDFLSDLFGPGGPSAPGGPLGPLGPFGPMAPLTPEVLDGLRNSVMDGGHRPGQEMYGADGYLGAGGAAGNDRPLGAYDGSFSAGRGLGGEHGHFGVHGRSGYSFGANQTVDEHGNVTGTAGGRAGAEIGFDGELRGLQGESTNISGSVGVEAYAEGGFTEGPDGGAGGAQAGVGAYAEGTLTAEGSQGGRATVTGTALAGADAGANAWAHLTRNEDGVRNGFTVGAEGRAFVGAEAGLAGEQTGPLGWFTHHAGVNAQAGLGGGAGSSLAVSTDEIGFRLSGDLAAGLGLSGSFGTSIHPNEIVDTFTPGDYNLDDAISDVGSALSPVGDKLSDINPFF